MHTSTNLIQAIAAIGRFLIAIIFVYSGIGKIMAPDATMAYIDAAGLPLPVVALGLAIAIELGGGLLLALGYRTRLVAAALAAFALVTGMAFHHAVGDPTQLMQLLKNIALAGGLLQVVVHGAGRYGVDGRARGRALRTAA